MIPSFILNSFLYLWSLSGVYSLSFSTIDGGTIDLNTYQSKKILLVNIAAGSDKEAQIGSLEKLYQRYKDSLVVIAFPSEDFTAGGATSSTISQLKNTYDIHFFVSAKTAVKGGNISGVYKWLTSITENGVSSNTVHNDFYKFLINSDGSLCGIFSPSVDPLDSVIVNAIEPSITNQPE